MRLVIVRHGESEFNKLIDIEGVQMFCGAKDISLTEFGKSQARNLEGNRELKSIEKVYASDLSRAIDTAKLAMPDREINIDARIRERSLGYFEGKYVEDMAKEYPELFKKEDNMKFRRDFVVKAPGGENYTDICIRLNSFFDSINLIQNTSYALFSHMHCIRCMLYLLLGLNKDDVKKLTIPNCELIILEGTELGKFKLISHKKEDLLTYK